MQLPERDGDGYLLDMNAWTPEIGRAMADAASLPSLISSVRSLASCSIERCSPAGPARNQCSDVRGSPRRVSRVPCLRGPPTTRCRKRPLASGFQRTAAPSGPLRRPRDRGRDRWAQAPAGRNARWRRRPRGSAHLESSDGQHRQQDAEGHRQAGAGS